MTPECELTEARRYCHIDQLTEPTGCRNRESRSCFITVMVRAKGGQIKKLSGSTNRSRWSDCSLCQVNVFVSNYFPRSHTNPSCTFIAWSNQNRYQLNKTKECPWISSNENGNKLLPSVLQHTTGYKLQFVSWRQIPISSPGINSGMWLSDRSVFAILISVKTLCTNTHQLLCSASPAREISQSKVIWRSSWTANYTIRFREASV